METIFFLLNVQLSKQIDKLNFYKMTKAKTLYSSDINKPIQ